MQNILKSCVLDKKLLVSHQNPLFSDWNDGPFTGSARFTPRIMAKWKWKGKTPGVFCLKMDFPFAISGAFLGS